MHNTPLIQHLVGLCTELQIELPVAQALVEAYKQRTQPQAEAIEQSIQALAAAGAPHAAPAVGDPAEPIPTVAAPAPVTPTPAPNYSAAPSVPDNSEIIFRRIERGELRAGESFYACRYNAESQTFEQLLTEKTPDTTFFEFTLLNNGQLEFHITPRLLAQAYEQRHLVEQTLVIETTAAEPGSIVGFKRGAHGTARIVDGRVVLESKAEMRIC